MDKSKISIFVAILININVMVGAGIYISPPQMASATSSFSFVGWILAALVFLPIVYGISQMSRFFPGEGGLYRYAKETFGPSCGYFSAWLYFLGFLGAEALQATAFYDTLRSTVDLGIFATNPTLFFICFFSIMYSMCCLDMRIVSTFQSAITLVKLSPIIFVISMIIWHPAGTPPAALSSSSNLLPTDSFSGIMATLPMAIFGYWGFEAACNFSHRIKGGHKNASIAILLGFFIVMSLYTLFHWQLLNIMGSSGLATDRVEGFFRYVGWNHAKGIRLGGLILALAILISYANAIYSEMTSYSFLIQALGKDEVLFGGKLFAKVNRFNQPIYAIALNGICACFLASYANGVGDLVAVANLGMISAFMITLLALGKIYRKEKNIIGSIIVVVGLVAVSIIVYFSFQKINGHKSLLLLTSLILLGSLLFGIQKAISTAQLKEQSSS